MWTITIFFLRFLWIQKIFGGEIIILSFCRFLFHSDFVVSVKKALQKNQKEEVFVPRTLQADIFITILG